MSDTTIKEIVIIGGGLGGLVTGAILSKEGYRVTILEQNKIVGGGLQCFYRNNTLFETGIHILGGFTPGGALTKICHYLGILDRLQILPTDVHCMDSIIFGDGSESYHIPSGREPFTEYFASLFPKEKDGLYQYMEALYSISNEVDLFYLRPDSGSPLRAHSADFLMAADEFIAKYISDPLLAELLAYMNPMYAGEQGHTPAFIHSLINTLYIDGSSTFIGGSQQMADALVWVIESAGGAVCAGERVVEIAVGEKKIGYIKCQSGNEYRGDLYISAIHPCTLLEMMPEKAFTRIYRERLQQIPNSYSSFTLFIKFKEGAGQPFVNHPCYYQREHGYIWRLGEYRQGELPRGFMYITTPSANQEEWAGHMSVNCPMPFSMVKKWENSSTGRRSADYYAWKEEMKEMLLKMLEIVSPGICSKIENCYTASPLTIRDYYGTKEGAIYGYNKDCKNIALSQISIATKVKNLLLTGQNVNLHGICGVPLTAIQTAEGLVGYGKIVENINRAYERRE